MLRSVTLTALCLGVVAWATKPTRDSFDQFFTKWTKQQIVTQYELAQQDSQQSLLSLGNVMVNSIVSAFSNRFADVKFKDLIVANYAYFLVRGKYHHFIGIFGRWYGLSAIEPALVQSSVNK